MQRQAWEEFCGGENDDSTKSSGGQKRTICSDHFEDECFRGGGKRVSEPGKRHVLKDGAIPTIREGPSLKIVQRRLEKIKQRNENMPEIRLTSIIEPAVKAENVCRICEFEDTLHDLSLEENAEHARRFISLTSIEIDVTAPWLCDGCLGRLNDAYEFVQACVEAENRRKSLPYMEIVEVKQEVVQECWDEPMIEFRNDSTEENKEVDEANGSEDYYNSEIEPAPKGPQLHNCEACQATFEKKSELFAHVKIHGKARYPCKLCERSFPRRIRLVEHMFSHKAEPSFFCTLCPSGFKNQTNLQRHVKNVHLKLKPYACEECDKQFAQKVQLQQHASVHLEQANIPCELCDMKFKTIFRQRVHVRTMHKDNQPLTTLECDVCFKQFLSQQSFVNHKGSHLEPNLLCSICGKKYKTNGLLAAHMTTHNPKTYACELCPSTFKTMKSLQYHRHVHSGLKPYLCELCDRTFRTKTHLKTHHLSVHTGEKPHECHVCQKRFTLKGNLRLHLKVHLGRNEGGGDENPESDCWSNEMI